MIPARQTQLSQPQIKRISIQDWQSGTVTDNDDGRTPLKGLKSSTNVWLKQDGIVGPRPSLTRWGPQPVGTVLGEIFEARYTTGGSSTIYLVTVQVVAGVAQVYTALPEDTTWTVRTGKTYNITARAEFLQIQNKVLVMNGEDTLSYLDLTTFTVIPFTTLSNPSSPSLTTNTGLTGTTFNVYYAITANSKAGETAGSSSLTVQVSTDRDAWNSATQSIRISWSAVAGAESYNVYVGQAAPSAGAPTLYAIATGLDPAVTTFTDNGTQPLQLTRPLPTYNSTAGPKCAGGTVINGRPWLVRDKDNPFNVYRGGDYGYELDFSPSNGGGSSPVGNGTKDLPTKVIPFRDGRGNSQVMVLCQGTNGSGKRFILSPTSVTYGSATISFYEVIEDNGKDGTDSPNGVIIYNDSAYYPSRDGFKTTGTKPQLQNILSTDRISNTIQRDIKTLNTGAMKNAVGLGWEGRLYWALPVNSDTNNEIWVLDLDRGGAWMKPWSIAASWIGLISDNDQTTHFVVLSNNVLYELSYIALTADNGTAFSTSGNSGQLTFSKDSRIWAKVLQVVFVLLRPQGVINFNVTGKTEDEPLSTVGQGSFVPTNTQAGWSEPGAGWSRLRGWSEIVSVPVSFNDSTQEVIVEVDEEVQWLAYSWNSTDVGVDYGLADVIVEYVEVGIKDLS